MGFEEVDRSGDIVIEARQLSKAFDKPLFKNLNVAVLRGQCIGVMGPNGSGKTTMIKTLIGQEKADGGEVKLGHKVQVGYHDQGPQSLDQNTTVVRAVWPEDDPEWIENDVRSLLGRFGLSGEIVFQRVGQLSGGEKAKAALARLCATSANLLVMDEPTNHLDIWSCEALERSIREFEGTVLVVSHDRYFLNQVADRIILLGNGNARVIEGDYETAQAILQKEKAEAAERSKPKASSAPAASPAPASSQQTKGGKPAKKFPYRKARDLENEISQLETEIAEVEDLLGQPATYRDAAKAVQTQERHVDLKQRLENLYPHWEYAVESNW
jgi:ATP-binding cassette subfamily F protein 3